MKIKQVQRVFIERTARKSYDVMETFIEVDGEFILARRELVGERRNGQPMWARVKTVEDVCNALKLPQGAF